MERAEVIFGPGLGLKGQSHSLVAKLLFVAKRARPDILTAVSALTTRVSNTDTDDMNKLRRIAKYLLGTPEQTLELCVGDNFSLETYVDAATEYISMERE